MASLVASQGMAGAVEPPHWGTGVGRPENCSVGGGGDMDARRRRGGGLEKWGSVSGPLFCVRTDIGAEGARAQILAWKFFSTNNSPPPPPTFQ